MEEKTTQINDEELQEFQRKHDTSPIGVWLVFVLDERVHTDPDQTSVAVFSNIAAADAWANSVKLPCLISPYVIDNPDYGEIPISKMN